MRTLRNWTRDWTKFREPKIVKGIFFKKKKRWQHCLFQIRPTNQCPLSPQGKCFHTENASHELSLEQRHTNASGLCFKGTETCGCQKTLDNILGHFSHLLSPAGNSSHLCCSWNSPCLSYSAKTLLWVVYLIISLTLETIETPRGKYTEGFVGSQSYIHTEAILQSLKIYIFVQVFSQCWNGCYPF